MKKFTFLLLLASVLSACTNPEQDAKIKAFWGTQFTHLLAAVAPGAALPAAALQRTQPNPQEMQEFEEMMKQWEQEQQSQENNEQFVLPEEAEEWPVTGVSANSAEVPAKPAASTPKTAPKTTAQTAKSAGTKTVAAKAAKPLNAYLVVSAQCGWCKKLKQEGWVEKFKDKYRGQVRLIEYDVTTPDGQAGYTKLMRRYKMSSVGTPALFIGDSVVRGYPLAEADAAVKKAIAKYGKGLPKAQASKQFMEITMENTSGPVKGKAPLKDRQQIQAALDKVLKDNQNALQDIGQMFGANTQAEAFAITAKTEKALRRQATASNSYLEYSKVQKQLLAQQEQSLNKLMKEHAQYIRDIR